MYPFGNVPSRIEMTMRPKAVSNHINYRATRVHPGAHKLTVHMAYTRSIFKRCRRQIKYIRHRHVLHRQGRGKAVKYGSALATSWKFVAEFFSRFLRTYIIV